MRNKYMAAGWRSGVPAPGGITVGMAMTERPDLFRVVLSDVGDSNALRAEYETDGDANSLEYGSVKTKPGFEALLAVDAVQSCEGRCGLSSRAAHQRASMTPRVAPWQPGKMAARLQAASPGGRPVLLRVDYDAGHGIGSTRTQRDELQADQIAFMLWQMGDPEFQPGGPPARLSLPLAVAVAGGRRWVMKAARAVGRGPRGALGCLAGPRRFAGPAAFLPAPAQH